MYHAITKKEEVNRMKKTTFTLNIEVLETLESRSDESAYINALYALIDAIKADRNIDTFDTVMDILEYAQDLIDGDGYYNLIRKLGDEFE